MKLIHALAVLLAAALATSGLSMIVYTLAHEERLPPGSQTLRYEFVVADRLGVDVGTDILRFGQLTPGASSSRTLSIVDQLAAATPGYTGRLMVLSARGEGASWIAIEPSVVRPPQMVKLTVVVPMDAPKGTYEGVITVIPQKTSS